MFRIFQYHWMKHMPCQAGDIWRSNAKLLPWSRGFQNPHRICRDVNSTKRSKEKFEVGGLAGQEFVAAMLERSLGPHHAHFETSQSVVICGEVQTTRSTVHLQPSAVLNCAQVPVWMSIISHGASKDLLISYLFLYLSLKVNETWPSTFSAAFGGVRRPQSPNSTGQDECQDKGPIDYYYIYMGVSANGLYQCISWVSKHLHSAEAN